MDIAKHVPETQMNSRVLNKALIFLLRHWREILAAENLVKLQANRASTVVGFKRTASSAAVISSGTEQGEIG